ncbi:MAG: LytR/AlgR family response regulator transcription factor [Marinifilaceae bacterium]
MTINYRTIIIDDEALARERLKKMLQHYTNRIEIVGEIRNGNQAIEQIEFLKPDLIFLDIQMPGKSGFEVLQEITHQPLVIFCTAYDQYALKAFETCSVDYLLKPLKEDCLSRSIEKLDLLRPNEIQTDIEKLLSQHINKFTRKELTSIPVKIGDRVIFVSLEDVSHFAAEDKYVKIHTISGKEYLIDHSLNYLEEKLGNGFARVQRGFIINISYIKEIKRYMGGKYILKLNNYNSSKIITGRNYQEVIKELMVF